MNDKWKTIITRCAEINDVENSPVIKTPTNTDIIDQDGNVLNPDSFGLPFIMNNRVGVEVAGFLTVIDGRCGLSTAGQH